MVDELIDVENIQDDIPIDNYPILSNGNYVD